MAQQASSDKPEQGEQRELKAGDKVLVEGEVTEFVEPTCLGVHVAFDTGGNARLLGWFNADKLRAVPQGGEGQGFGGAMGVEEARELVLDVISQVARDPSKLVDCAGEYALNAFESAVRAAAVSQGGEGHEIAMLRGLLAVQKERIAQLEAHQNDTDKRIAGLRLAEAPHQHTDACFAKRITEGGKSVEYLICGKVAGAPQEPIMPKHYIVFASAEEQQKGATILAKHMSQSGAGAPQEPGVETASYRSVIAQAIEEMESSDYRGGVSLSTLQEMKRVLSGGAASGTQQTVDQQGALPHIPKELLRDICADVMVITYGYTGSLEQGHRAIENRLKGWLRAALHSARPEVGE